VHTIHFSQIMPVGPIDGDVMSAEVSLWESNKADAAHEYFRVAGDSETAVQHSDFCVGK